MSIPDPNLLKFTLELDCGHKRRNMSPVRVGDKLPCLDDAHKLEQHAIVRIINTETGKEAGQNEMDDAMSMHARMHMLHDQKHAEAESLPWWRWRARAKAREEAKRYALVGAGLGLRLKDFF